MLILYNLFIALYALGIRTASLWNQKAAAWIDGRRDVFSLLQDRLLPTDKVVWVHCSSAGEFEQGKPVIEALKQQYSTIKILVTFFSPSGYDAAKNYPHADVLTYLPLDTKENAKRFLQLARPRLVIFVKYEFWYHHLSAAAFEHTPILLISAVFRKDQLFFQSYGRFFKQILYLFRHLFVQDNPSLQLLQAAGINHCSIGGDARFDRVVKITESSTGIPFIPAFIAGSKVIVAGSTWPGDEALLAQYSREHPDRKFIIAPHEINKDHIKALQAIFPDALLYSSYSGKGPNATGQKDLALAQVLIIDAVGLLSRLYQYASIAYVGGGFTKDGIHNILEAAVWGKPVVFGPNYKKYREGRELIQSGGAFSIGTMEELKKIADGLLKNERHLQEVSGKAKTYVLENTGATNTILAFIQENRLLTS